MLSCCAVCSFTPTHIKNEKDGHCASYIRYGLAPVGHALAELIGPLANPRALTEKDMPRGEDVDNLAYETVGLVAAGCKHDEKEKKPSHGPGQDMEKWRSRPTSWPRLPKRWRHSE